MPLERPTPWLIDKPPVMETHSPTHMYQPAQELKPSLLRLLELKPTFQSQPATVEFTLKPLRLHQTHHLTLPSVNHHHKRELLHTLTREPQLEPLLIPSFQLLVDQSPMLKHQPHTDIQAIQKALKPQEMEVPLLKFQRPPQMVEPLILLNQQEFKVDTQLLTLLKPLLEAAPNH